MAARSGRSETPRWVENTPVGGRRVDLGLREAWDFREVGVILAQRDLKVRYQQTLLGFAWAVLQPLVALLVFTIVLGEVRGLSPEGTPYAAFAIVGLALWFPFSSAVTGAAESLVATPDLVTKVYFPRMLAPAGAVAAMAVDVAIGLAIAVVTALVAGVELTPRVVVLPVCGLGALIAALAFGLWLAALTVLYRDVRYIVGFAMQLLFFASPVVYSSDLPSGALQWVFALNPVVGVLDAARWALLGSPTMTWHVLVSGLSALLLLAAGARFFRRTEQRFADRI